MLLICSLRLCSRPHCYCYRLYRTPAMNCSYNTTHARTSTFYTPWSQRRANGRPLGLPQGQTPGGRTSRHERQSGHVRYRYYEKKRQRWRRNQRRSVVNMSSFDTVCNYLANIPIYEYSLILLEEYTIAIRIYLYYLIYRI